MIIVSALQYFHCVLSNMIQLGGTGITPINIFTLVQQANSDVLLILFGCCVK